jgi:hypothetical protein
VAVLRAAAGAARLLQAVLVEALQLGPAVLEQLRPLALHLAGRTGAAPAGGGDR